MTLFLGEKIVLSRTNGDPTPYCKLSPDSYAVMNGSRNESISALKWVS